jgi:hypothetical protein
MCLVSATKIYKRPTRQNNWQTGYKVFEKRQGKLWFPFHNTRSVPTNQVVIDTNRKREEVYDSKDTYQLGFHIFVNLQDALRYRKTSSSKIYEVFEVKYRRVTARGKQYIADGKGDDVVCVVARQMIVL